MITNIGIAGHPAKGHTINIPEGTDFNLPAVLTTDSARCIIAPQIVDNLPPLLREGVNRLLEDNDKRVFLVSALAVLSGVMPNVRGYYDGKQLSPNLFAFIVGGYGTGKGAAHYARCLIEQIEEELEKNNEANFLDWQQLEPDERNGSRPKRDGIIIPANASASVFIQRLNEYGGNGILFETEGDTLAQTLATDYGNYSDALRKAFHHEPMSMDRRTNNEAVRLKHPQLSVLLTGTPDQLRKLAPDARNGLFSRFLYLTIEAEDGFRDVFAPGKDKYNDEFRRLGSKVYSMHQFLSGLSDNVTFTFTKDQQEHFVSKYRADKPGFIADTGNETAGVFHRLALINFRVAMQLATLRQFDELGTIPAQIVCSEIDYKNAMRITDCLTSETLRVYYSMPEIKGDDEDHPDTKEMIEAANLVKAGMSLREAAKDKNISKSKLGRYCQKHGIKSGKRGGPGTVGQWDS